jgi:hypothetical protein
MSDTCRRGCCWSPYSCARGRLCACHPTGIHQLLGIPTEEPPVRLDHRDPTPEAALRNIERERKRNK